MNPLGLGGTDIVAGYRLVEPDRMTTIIPTGRGDAYLPQRAGRHPERWMVGASCFESRAIDLR